MTQPLAVTTLNLPGQRGFLAANTQFKAT
jgi:hypothetical protein